MIEVEIRGPVAKKEYAKLKKLLATAGEDINEEKRISVQYRGIDFGVLADMEIQDGAVSKITIRDRRADREVALSLFGGQLSETLKFCASLGYVKGEVYVREVFSARYGGATFSLVDPLEDEGYYYEAVISAQDPVEVKEAKEKLETLAKKFKLPQWSEPEMQSFFTSLARRVNYTFDFTQHGADHFKEKFNI